MSSHEPIPNLRRTERDRRSDEQLPLLDDDEVEMLDDDRRVTADRSRSPFDRHAEPPATDKKGNLFDRPTDPGNDRWHQIQADFVDDPRRSISAAHDLVGEMIESIIRDLNRERDGLNQRWSDEKVSTEDMRVCFQRYRDFYHQLLARSAGGWEKKV